MRVFICALLLCSTAATAAPSKMTRARDLDASVMPRELAFERDRLVVDGTPVRGSIMKQLDYLEIVLAREAGKDPSELDFQARRRALRMRGAGVGTFAAAAGVGVTLLAVAAPPMAGLAAVIAIQGGGVALLHQSSVLYDEAGLRNRVNLYGMGTITDP